MSGPLASLATSSGAATVLAALISGLVVAAVARYNGWLSQRTVRAQKAEDRSAAQIAAEEQDRRRVSDDMRWIVEALRAEVIDLRKQLAEEKAQREAQLAEERAQREALERRADQLDAEVLLMRRELARHGIPWPPSKGPSKP